MAKTQRAAYGLHGLSGGYRALPNRHATSGHCHRQQRTPAGRGQLVSRGTKRRTTKGNDLCYDE